MDPNLVRYSKAGHRRVEGWLLPGAIGAVCELSARQRERAIEGGACEIGVHHGRLFILLHLLTVPPERSLAIDLFEMQDENVDASGRGSREALLQNLRRHACDVSRIELLAANSLHLTAATILERCGARPRLFSVDGGHTASITQNDLGVAAQSICDGGLVILDDYFNSSWPAVSEGTCAFMSAQPGRLLPVAITSNKFFFTNGADAAADYRSVLLRRHPGAKVSTVFGHAVVCFESPHHRSLRERVTGTPQWLRIRKTPIGRALMTLKRWM